MAKYVILASYTPESWARLIENPGDRTSAAREAVESVGASIESTYFMFGAHDALVVVDAPDSLTQAAISVGVASSGAFRSFETHELIAPSDLGTLLSKAKTVAEAYRPPGR